MRTNSPRPGPGSAQYQPYPQWVVYVRPYIDEMPRSSSFLLGGLLGKRRWAAASDEDNSFIQWILRCVILTLSLLFYPQCSGWWWWWWLDQDHCGLPQRSLRLAFEINSIRIQNLFPNMFVMFSVLVMLQILQARAFSNHILHARKVFDRLPERGMFNGYFVNI